MPHVNDSQAKGRKRVQMEDLCVSGRKREREWEKERKKERERERDNKPRG
jgi:hypothetical protein